LIKIGINGFGRIGRNVYRAALESKGFGKDFDIVAVNDIAPIDSLAHLTSRSRGLLSTLAEGSSRSRRSRTRPRYRGGSSVRTS
jgi:glyceraldehyde-3-phosphate dehydrogenase/erythrose-4-phosphate dehydrogenase